MEDVNRICFTNLISGFSLDIDGWIRCVPGHF